VLSARVRLSLAEDVARASPRGFSKTPVIARRSLSTQFDTPHILNKRPRRFSHRGARAVSSSPHSASRRPRTIAWRRIFVNRPGDFTRLAMRSVGRSPLSANRRALSVGRRARTAGGRAFSVYRRPRYADWRPRTGRRRARAVNRRPRISIMTRVSATIPTLLSLFPSLHIAKPIRMSS